MRTPAQATAWNIVAPLLGELRAADVVLIGTPMYNYSIPAALKAWLDQAVWSVPGTIRHSRICVKTMSAHTRSPLKPLTGLARSTEMNWLVLILAPSKEATHG